MELRLTNKEHELLLELLNDQLKHLLHEINKAHHHDAKIALRERCTTLEEILRRMNEQVPSTV
jgi:hypothetical protein